MAGLSCGGWCPANRAAEDGEIPDRYPPTSLPLVKASATSEVLSARQVAEQYRARTLKNVQMGGGTVILFSATLSGGTLLTRNLCALLKRPYILIRAQETPEAEAILKFIDDNGVKVLNVGGPRASGWIDGYRFALATIEQVLSSIRASSCSR